MARALSMFLVTGLMLATGHAQQVGLDINYDPATGHLSVAHEPDVQGYWRFVSKSGVFNGTPENIFDYYKHGLDFIVTRHSDPVVDFGPIADLGLETSFLLDDLCVYRKNGPDGGPNQPTNGVRLNGVDVSLSAEGCVLPPDPNAAASLTGDPRAVIHYDSVTGNMSVDVADLDSDGGATLMTTVEIKSKRGIFTGSPAQGLVSQLDVDTDVKIFKISTRGFGDVDFGPVAQTGLSNSEFVSDLCVDGSWLSGGHALVEYEYPGAGLVPLSCNADGEHPQTDVVLDYDSASGDLVIELAQSAGVGAAGGGSAEGPLSAEQADEFTTLEIYSAAGIFSGERPLSLTAEFDVFTPHRILKQNRDGFGVLRLSGIVDSGMSPQDLLDDLTLDITTLQNAGISRVTLAVPEPSSLILVVAGGLLLLRRRRS